MANAVEIIVCASGKSSRFLSNKLLDELPTGNNILYMTLAQIKKESSCRCTVIFPPEQPEMMKTVVKSSCEAQVLSPASKGLSDTIAHSVKLYPDAVGWLICLADMPSIKPNIYKTICAMASLNKIIAPTFEGRRGHPVYFPNRFYSELAVLTGDKGAASIISQFHKEVVLLPVKEAAITEDIDTLLDLDKYLSKNIK